MKGTGFVVYRKNEFIDLTDVSSQEKLESLINEIENLQTKVLNASSECLKKLYEHNNCLDGKFIKF